MSSRVIKVTAGIAIVLGLFVLWASYTIHHVPLFKLEKLTDCTADNLSFRMLIRYHEPRQLIFGLPHAVDSPLNFRGEVQVSQSSQLVARIPISSDDIMPCNWLDPGLSGYIVTWSHTNQGERLDDFLVRGQSYDVQVAFSQSPPRGGSLWLSSVGRAGEH